MVIGAQNRVQGSQVCGTFLGVSEVWSTQDLMSVEYRDLRRVGFRDLRSVGNRHLKRVGYRGLRKCSVHRGSWNFPCSFFSVNQNIQKFY